MASALLFGLAIALMPDLGAHPIKEPLDAPSLGPTASSTLVINEIQPWPSVTGLEYVEIWNRGSVPVELPSLGLADDRLFTSGPSVIRPVPTAGILLEPGAYLVLVQDAGAFSSHFPGIHHVEVPGWPPLNNGGDTVVLLDGSEVLDAVPYRSAWRIAFAALERIDPGGPSDAASNWAGSIDPAGGTPGRLNSRYDPDVRGPVALFAEQSGEAAVRIRFDEELDPASALSSDIRTDRAIPCSAHGLTDGGRELRLQCPDLKSVSGLRVTGIVDLVGNRLADTLLPLARLPDRAQLVLSEMLFDPIADDFDGLPNQPEFVELHNDSPYLLGLRTCRLTGDADERGEADSLALVDSFRAIPAHAYAVVVAEPDAVPPTPSPLLDAAFPMRDTALAEIVALRRSSLGLTNSGRLLHLVCAGRSIDSVRYAPSWHHPFVTEPRGRSLERRSPGAPSTVSWNWSTSTAEAGATPGERNSVDMSAGSGPDSLSANRTASRFTPNADGRDDTAIFWLDTGGQGALMRSIVFDVDGRPVRTLEQARFVGGRVEVVWDGTDDSGKLLAPGPYVLWVETVDGSTGHVRRTKRIAVLAGS